MQVDPEKQEVSFECFELSGTAERIARDFITEIVELDRNRGSKN